MERLTLGELNERFGQADGSDKVAAALCLQVQTATPKKTSGGKPYLELELAEGGGALKMRVWDNLPGYPVATTLAKGDVRVFSGLWKRGDFGLECELEQVTAISEREKCEFFRGPAELRAKQLQDWQMLMVAVDQMDKGSPYTRLVRAFLSEQEALFQRAAAARGNHHARRGGLVEHVAFMARSAVAQCGVYARVIPLNLELLVAGVVFHDCGKLWENNYPEEGFEQLFDFRAEALGHITIGIEVVNHYWRRVVDPALHAEAKVAAESWRMALLHLIAAHHGTKEWGSPVFPGSPEAWLLHMVDNIDAKLEMMRAALNGGGKDLRAEASGARIVEKVRPLEANLLVPATAPEHWWAPGAEASGQS